MSDTFYNSADGTDLGTYLTLSTTLTGAMNLAVDILYYKLGSLVTVQWPTRAQTALAASTISIAAPLPVGFRPLEDFTMPMHVLNNATMQNGIIQIAAATGFIFWYSDALLSNFTNGVGARLDSGAVSFMTA